MKKVLVPLAVRVLSEEDSTLQHTVLESYVEKLLAHNLEPRFIAAPFPYELMEAAYAESSGVFLVGGSDFHAHLYGEHPHEKTEPLCARRDEMDLRIARHAIRDKKPILGICRGNQALVIASGGTLDQHLPESCPGERHGLSEEVASYGALMEGKGMHPVILEEGSRIAQIVGKTEIMVTSAHHQAAKTVGDGFRITGRSPGGVAEIVERALPDHFCFGVQSHPEAEKSGDLEPLLAAFAEAVGVF